MPEIAEVARVVHFIRKHLVGHKIVQAVGYEDSNVFGKAGCTAGEVEKALQGKTIAGAQQQGKYFWLELSSPPHLLMHFSMAGWFHIKGIKTGYREAGQDKAEPESWPPKYVKFTIKTDNGQEAAFVDFRRFGRIRLVDCPASQMRNTSPLKENGPDPVVDKDKVSVDFLESLCARKRAPIKAVLLDQGNISGIGNWVSDEVFYDAKIHPEQYSHTLSQTQIKQLHKSIHHVCGLACDVLADSSKFPESWLFKWRWGKGKKDAAQVLPNGEKIQYLTVGGRTSAIIPSAQKKTGAVSADVGDDGNGDDDAGTKKDKAKSKQTSKAKSRKADKVEEDEDKKQPSGPAKKKAKTGANGTSRRAAEPVSAASKKTGSAGKANVKKEEPEVESGRRRSSRRVSSA